MWNEIEGRGRRSRDDIGSATETKEMASENSRMRKFRASKQRDGAKSHGLTEASIEMAPTVSFPLDHGRAKRKMTATAAARRRKKSSRFNETKGIERPCCDGNGPWGNEEEGA